MLYISYYVLSGVLNSHSSVTFKSVFISIYTALSQQRVADTDQLYGRQAKPLPYTAIIFLGVRLVPNWWPKLNDRSTYML